jgi:Ca2+-binding EF-hand superfamily protein
MGCGSSRTTSAEEEKAPEPDFVKPPRPPQPSPPPPSILREIFNDIAANIAEIDSGSGKANAKGIIALIREICVISGEDPHVMPKAFQIDEVMEKLDVNKNGFIEFGEFLHWTALQCGLSTNERNKVRQRNDLADRMQNFVLAIRKAAKIMLVEKRQIEARLEPLRIGIDKIFSRFDVDTSGFLNQTEIVVLLRELLPSATAPERQGDIEADAMEILNALDSDGNGQVEQAEFTDWVMQGLSRPRRSREIFASYSTFHQRMEHMLSGIEKVALEASGMTAPDVFTEAPSSKEEEAVDQWAAGPHDGTSVDGSNTSSPEDNNGGLFR